MKEFYKTKVTFVIVSKEPTRIKDLNHVIDSLEFKNSDCVTKLTSTKQEKLTEVQTKQFLKNISIYPEYLGID